MCFFYNAHFMSKRIRAELVLILITILWGISFPIIELTVKTISSNQLVFWRFLVSAVFLLPFVIHLLNKTNKTLLFFSGILGAINFISYFTQTMGLERKESTNLQHLSELAFVRTAKLFFQ